MGRISQIIVFLTLLYCAIESGVGVNNVLTSAENQNQIRHPQQGLTLTQFHGLGMFQLACGAYQLPDDVTNLYHINVEERKGRSGVIGGGGGGGVSKVIASVTATGKSGSLFLKSHSFLDVVCTNISIRY